MCVCVCGVHVSEFGRYCYPKQHRYLINPRCGQCILIVHQSFTIACTEFLNYTFACLMIFSTVTLGACITYGIFPGISMWWCTRVNYIFFFLPPKATASCCGTAGCQKVKCLVASIFFIYIRCRFHESKAGLLS